MRATFSVIIPTVDRPGLLRRALESLLPQVDQKPFEIIVVDQSANEETAALCRELQPIQLIRRDTRGLSASRNAGGRRAVGDWLIFADDDCWFPPNWVPAVENTLMATPGDIVAALVVDASGRPLLVSGPCEAQDLRPKQAWLCHGSSVYVRRTAFEALSGFDERLGVGRWWGAGEETEFLLRAMEKGLRCRLEPGIVVYHPRPPAALAASARRMLSYGRGQGAVLRLHMEGALAAELAPMARRILLHPLWRLLHERPGLHNWSEALASLLGQSQGFVTFRGSPWPATFEPPPGLAQSALTMFRALALLSRTSGRIS